MKSISTAAFLFLFLCSCTQKSPDRSLNDSVKEKKININPDTLKTTINKDTIKKETAEADTLVQHPPGKNTFYFQPYQYELTGILTAEMFYGPPNFGDSPSTDAKETIYMLNFAHRVNVVICPGDEDKPIHDFDAPTMGIKKMQVSVIGNDSLLIPWILCLITN